MPLPNSTTIYPGHGAGSSCGKNMSAETFDSLENQKKTNYALRMDMTKEAFIQEVTTGLVAPPQYFPKNVQMNKGINATYRSIIQNGNQPLSLSKFENLANESNTLILDVRNEKDFVKGFIKNSLFFGIDGTFAPWVGAIIEDVNTSILLICPEGREEETITRLSRVGYDNVKGYLEGGFDTWLKAGKEMEQLKSISPENFVQNYYPKNIKIVDVRKETEFNSERILHKNIANLPLANAMNNLKELDKSSDIYTHCRGGYRSVIYASILKKKGFKNPINIEGGFEKLKGIETIEISSSTCTSK
jgi:rhodanese-related sulfurtransferase